MIGSISRTATHTAARTGARLVAIASIALLAGCFSEEEGSGNPAERFTGLVYENCGGFATLSFGEGSTFKLSGPTGISIEGKYELRENDQLALLNPMLGAELIDIIDGNKLKVKMTKPRKQGFGLRKEEVVCTPS